ncbi:Glomulin [Sciurus carolinensis]|uniref:Glomulin n=1 Tax=Sciurus carolinensis TaxID=30640 RepID=A0AA41MF86_SCICA|nr:Glomulin [Sciurus carolinensis]
MYLCAIYLGFKQISLFLKRENKLSYGIFFAYVLVFLFLLFSQQILEEHDFKEEDFGLFQLAGQRCIEEGHTDQLIAIIQNEKNKVIIKTMGWNLVGPVVRCLLWNDEDDKRKDYFLMLDLLVKLCNPKELLLGLLELIEEPSGKQISQIILLLLQPLQTVIQKLRNNKAYSVGLALSTLWSQLSLLPVPYSKEQIQTDDYGLCQCCKALIEFTKPFVEEVTNDKENKENEKLKDELLKFCFKSLKCPLLTAQFLEQSEEAGSDPLRCFACEIIGFLSAIGHPFPKIIFNHGRKKKTWDYLEVEEEEDKQLADSMASLAYLVFVQGISIDQLPMVLSKRVKRNSEIADNTTVQKSKDLCSVTVGGEEIPNMPPEMQLKVLHSALFTFDLIESVLARVEELIEIKTKSTSQENVGIK